MIEQHKAKKQNQRPKNYQNKNKNNNNAQNIKKQHKQTVEHKPVAEPTKISTQDIKIKGKAKFLHKTIRGILFPVFHPYITLLALFLIWFTPTFFGAKPKNVHKWYAHKISEIFSQAIPSKQIISNIENIKNNVLQTNKKTNNIDLIENPHQSTDAINNRRKIFLKTQEMQSNIAKELNIAKNQQAINPIANPIKANIKLKRLSTPEYINGDARIINANQVIINNRNIILYGIYVDPLTAQGIKARDFLEKTISNKPLNCEVVALTMQDIPTAYCTVNNTNINYLLVEENLSKDVLLGQ